MEETPQDDAPEDSAFDDESTTSEAPRPARLERIEQGRWIGGVATGLAYYFNMPVWLVRVAFLLLLIPGGFGLGAYVIALLVLPHEAENDGIAVRWLDEIERPSQWLGGFLALLGVSVFLATFTEVSAGLVWVIALTGGGWLLFRKGGDVDFNRFSGTAGSAASAESDDSDYVASAPRTPREPREPRVRPVRIPKAPTVREPRVRKVRPPRPHSDLGRYTFSALLIGLAAVGTGDLLDVLNPSILDYFAIALGILGLGLLVGTWLGRSRGLILVGLLLTPVVLLMAVIQPHISSDGFTTANANWDWDWSDTNSWDTDFPEGLQRIVVEDVDGNYRFSGPPGSYEFDFTDVVFADGDEIDIDIPAGEITVTLPRNVHATGRGRATVGEVTVFNHRAEGIGSIRVTETAGPSNGPEITVAVRLGLGEVTIEQG